MAQWKKRETGKDSIDFETLEGLLEELIYETFDADEIDMNEPLQLAFSINARPDGSIQVNRFGILNEQVPKQEKKEDSPLIELIDADKEYIIVIEANKLPDNDVDIKLLDHAIIVSCNNGKTFLKKIIFPEKVIQESFRTSTNNNIFEIRVSKRDVLKKIKEKN
ncbi:MAG: hypothetical protein COV47_05925 [Candidatus Diapherotrites archaeon CG11_big_fil_rev_8_21_14_0_20_37_9]|nr:MAG: hypothetical protein COV47_05925 [Candidatus Diapherotrites archaeon CG11_big_fil_rev_8_21_14_0_20_37_9]